MIRARTLMVQGTASHAGKSVVTAALCRSLARRGWRVAPFKAQNMSLNSAVAADGGEIGRSQAFQAAACGIEPETAMNPVLLKPMAGGRCAVILQGRPYGIAEGASTPEQARLALEAARNGLDSLRRRFDVVVLEGMGSPAEINLRGRDIANMRAAELADAPVLLVGDIERGGVFAALAGTMELLAPAERRRVAGFLVNKYHGDPAALAPGTAELERRYGVPTLGILPWLPDLAVDEEDAVALPRASGTAAGDAVEVVVPRLPGLANFTDLAPLEREPEVRVRYVDGAADWGRPALVILPGSRSVAADLRWLRETGLAARVREHARAGGRVIGICGGYQMLGREIRDPEGVESLEARVEGLCLLDVVTTFAAAKTLERVEAVSLAPELEGAAAAGYEIHHGVTLHGTGAAPAFRILRRQSGAAGEEWEGAVDGSGRILGSYLHGLFDRAEFRSALLARLGVRAAPAAVPDALFERLADWLDASVDVERVLELTGLAQGGTATVKGARR